ncbi:MAG: DUF411 domain-containing protein [Gammaproteobacteria bacterium]|jgi:hypothetical protein|nr:metal-binding protein [Gammaproteobacteria bacterium]MDP6096021.1 DUF411 domain-containing protein [Gammaproteobacteria bacterium]HJO11913.1 DUF411 domain-containing protein [Gammaproteobacteria bacterium]|tara:strand:+ start:3511 stop:4008 length:498 start_codon:yes stop_codon:yes gene_type:complete
MNRNLITRSLQQFCCALALFTLTSFNASAQTFKEIVMDVHKEVTCGCCVGWIAHMDEQGFASNVHDSRTLNSLKQQLGVLPKWQSCHTAVTSEGYVFEGHVPAKFIKQFIASPPAGALGLAAPGMPLGSPGMVIGNQFTPYNVILMKKDGSSEVYASIATAEEQY